MSEWIPEEEWATIVEHAPIPSVDLVVECPAGIVLGQRANAPAKGEWFVSGDECRKASHLRRPSTGSPRRNSTPRSRSNGRWARSDYAGPTSL